MRIIFNIYYSDDIRCLRIVGLPVTVHVSKFTEICQSNMSCIELLPLVSLLEIPLISVSKN